MDTDYIVLPREFPDTMRNDYMPPMPSILEQILR